MEELRFQFKLTLQGSAGPTVNNDPFRVEDKIVAHFATMGAPMATQEDFPFGEGKLSGLRPNFDKRGKETRILRDVLAMTGKIVVAGGAKQTPVRRL